MSLKKLAIILVTAISLFGCSTSKPTAYEGMNAKDAFTSAIDKMNNELSYSKMIFELKGGESITEAYKENDEFKCVFQNDFNGMYSCNLNDSGKGYYAGNDGNIMQFFSYDQENEPITKMYNSVFENEKSKILDTSREDKNGEIIITIKYSFESPKYDDEGNEMKGEYQTIYISLTDTINEDGYLVKEIIERYEDEAFTKKIEDATQKVQFVDFNKKELKDFDKTRELIENCDGKTYEEFKESIQ